MNTVALARRHHGMATCLPGSEQHGLRDVLLLIPYHRLDILVLNYAPTYLFIC